MTPPFQTHENLEHLTKILQVVLGPIQRDVIKRADRHAQKYFRNEVSTGPKEVRALRAHEQWRK